MNIYDLSDLAIKNNGECILGSAELHTHACYFIYGIMDPQEKGRLIKPGEGHEEIVCLIKGQAVLRRDSETFQLKQGQAFHLRGEEAFSMDNNGSDKAVYVIAGGHSEGHEH